MKLVHNITISVFAKEHDDIVAIKEALNAFVPLDFEKENLKVEIQKAEGFDSKINIMSILLSKPSHTTAAIDLLRAKLSEEQKEILLEQTSSRVDEELNYFVRFDKDFWVEKRELELTDFGNCFHFKFVLACYPKKLEIALELAKKLLTGKNI